VHGAEIKLCTHLSESKDQYEGVAWAINGFHEHCCRPLVRDLYTVYVVGRIKQRRRDHQRLHFYLGVNNKQRRYSGVVGIQILPLLGNVQVAPHIWHAARSAYKATTTDKSQASAQTKYWLPTNRKLLLRAHQFHQRWGRECLVLVNFVVWTHARTKRCTSAASHEPQSRGAIS
jgi:hypothetical protein